MPEVAKKKRIFQIAKELNISHMEIIQFLKNNGTVVESHMAPVTPEAYDEILLEFSKDKLQIERHRKEQARKIVVSKIHKKEVEDPNAPITSEKPAVRKLKTSLKEEKLALSDKLKDASDKLIKEKKKVDADKDIADAKIKTEKPDPAINGSAAPKAKLDSAKPRIIKGETIKLTQLETPAVAPSAPRKLKKISIQDIADKINQTKKRAPKGKGEPSKPQIKQPLPQFGKSGAKKKSKKKDKNIDVESSDIKKSIKVPEFTTVDELAQSMDVTAQEVIMACMGLGMMVTINQRMDMDNIILIADEFGFEVETVTEFAEEKTSQDLTEEDIKNAEKLGYKIGIINVVWIKPFTMKKEWEKAIKPEVAYQYSQIPNTHLYFKFVVMDEQDLEEVEMARKAYNEYGVNGDIYLMPVGATVEGQAKTGRQVAEICLQYGYKFSPRLHVDLFGNKWGT